MSSLEMQFHAEMLGIYQKGKKKCNYSATRFLQMVSELGGVAAARTILQGEPQEGFGRLWKCDCLDLTMEALILKPEYASLFTTYERRIARERLVGCGYSPDQAEETTQTACAPSKHEVGAPSLGGAEGLQAAADETPTLTDNPIAAELIRLARMLEEKKVKVPGVGEFTPDKAANEFLLRTPLAFLIAVISDYGIKAERAWALPYRLSQRLGHFDASKLAELDVDSLGDVMSRPPALHRFNRNVSDWIIRTCRHTVRVYQGDVGNLWAHVPSSATLYARLTQIPGIGQKKASMAVNIIARGEYGGMVRDRTNIDVSYDAHVRRVFLRSGLVDLDTPEAVITKARDLNPQYPGIFDLPAWVIGRTWCHPTAPACSACWLGKVCPRRRATSHSTA